jgi:hypothetical protein
MYWLVCCIFKIYTTIYYTYNIKQTNQYMHLYIKKHYIIRNTAMRRNYAAH